jgi:surface antigen
VLGAVAATGCSYPLETMFKKSEADLEQTGSTALGYRAALTADTATPSEVDLAYARAVAAEALARGAKDNSIPWENPHTGASGNITPLAASYSEGAFICRDFLASYVHGQSQAWLQGEACRTEHGKWEVTSLKPMRS